MKKIVFGISLLLFVNLAGATAVYNATKTGDKSQPTFNIAYAGMTFRPGEYWVADYNVISSRCTRYDAETYSCSVKAMSKGALIDFGYIIFDMNPTHQLRIKSAVGDVTIAGYHYYANLDQPDRLLYQAKKAPENDDDLLTKVIFSKE